MEVTRELEQSIPSQPSAQGSEPTQLGGLMPHSCIRIIRAETASEICQAEIPYY